MDQLHLGKTSLGVEVAKILNGEIISADSMQIYKEMNIGTAKVTPEEMQGIPHYLIDFLNPDEEYNVSLYAESANQKVKEILEKEKVPIIVGGTGLYVDTLINGIEFKEIENDIEYRMELESVLLKENGIDILYEKLKEVDFDSYQKIDKNNVRRVMRALEIYKVTGKTKTELDKESQKGSPYDFIVFGIEWDREELYDRINKRVDIMINDGLVDEVKSLNSKYHLSKTALQGLGYKEVIEYLNNQIDYDEMIDKIKKESRHYAKRQMTWFRHIDNIIWLDGKDKDKMVNTVINEYKKTNE